MQFPKKVHIKLVDDNFEKLNIDNIILQIKLIPPQKNIYYLGPFFSNNRGEYELNKNILEISANAVIESGVMDYVHYEKCENVVQIQILSIDEIKNMINGREIWGLLGEESQLYDTKERLIEKLNKSNNPLVIPKSFNIDFKNLEKEVNLSVKLSNEN